MIFHNEITNKRKTKQMFIFWYNLCFFRLSNTTIMKNILLLLTASVLLFSCTKPKGKVSLTYNKATAVYGVLNEVRNQPLLIPQQPLENPGKIYVGNDYVLVGEKGKGIHIFDNSNMTNPIRFSFIQIPYNKEFFVKDNMLYAESLYDFIKIDISDVYHPVIVDREENVFGTPLTNDKGESLIRFNYTVATDEFELNSPEAKEIERKGKLHIDYKGKLIPESSVPTSFANSNNGAGTLNRIAVDFGHVYILTGSKLHVLDNTSTALSYIDNINLSEGMETVYTYDNKIYIGSQDGVLTYDASTPEKPSKISEFNHTTSCDPVLPNGTRAFLTLRSVENQGCNYEGENTLNVIDMSDEDEPVIAQSIEMNTPYGMAIINNYLFVGQGENGFSVFDISSDDEIEEIATVTGLVAFDIMQHPTNPNILLVTNSYGIKEYNIDYSTFVVSPIGTINY